MPIVFACRYGAEAMQVPWESSTPNGLSYRKYVDEVFAERCSTTAATLHRNDLACGFKVCWRADCRRWPKEWCCAICNLVCIFVRCRAHAHPAQTARGANKPTYTCVCSRIYEWKRALIRLQVLYSQIPDNHAEALFRYLADHDIGVIHLVRVSAAMMLFTNMR